MAAPDKFHNSSQRDNRKLASHNVAGNRAHKPSRPATVALERGCVEDQPQHIRTQETPKK
jgi:hypothetical protein